MTAFLGGVASVAAVGAVLVAASSVATYPRRAVGVWLVALVASGCAGAWVAL